jgi:hypothetical protein
MINKTAEVAIRNITGTIVTAIGMIMKAAMETMTDLTIIAGQMTLMILKSEREVMADEPMSQAIMRNLHVAENKLSVYRMGFKNNGKCYLLA